MTQDADTADTDPSPTHEEIMRFRRYECRTSGHSWEVIETLGGGPTAVKCGHCGKDSGMRRLI